MIQNFDHLPSAQDIDTSIGRVGWGFIVVGIIVAGIGLIWMTKTALFIRGAVKVPGEIVTVTSRVTQVAGRDDPFAGTTHKPTVAFTDLKGVRHEVVSSRLSGRDTFSTGDGVQVFYDPADPQQMFIDNRRTLWFAPGIITGMGLFFLLFMGWCFYLMR
jgi:hypothetical protein